MKKNQKSLRKVVASSSATRRTRRQTLRSALPELLEGRVLMAFNSVFEVTSNADSGAGSLRAAICAVNQDGMDSATATMADEITFDLPAGQTQITLQSALPSLMNAVVINGTTQPGYSGSPIVWLTASSALAGNGSDAITLEGNNSGVVGLAITGFNGGAAVELAGADSFVTGSYLGIDPSGGTALPALGYGTEFNYYGVSADGANATIANDVISDNEYGIQITADGATVTGNFIGTDPTGQYSRGNEEAGINVENAANVTIGGDTAGDRNVISGNFNDGIDLIETGGNDVVEANYIGLNADGTAAVQIPSTSPDDSKSGNLGDGIYVSTSNDGDFTGVTIETNAISSNQADGIEIWGASGNTIQGNIIGSDISGQNAVGLQANGIDIEDDSTDNTIGGAGSAGNLIVGNNGNGIYVYAYGYVGLSGNVIAGNQIGTAALPNDGDGILADSDVVIGVPAEGNTISYNGSNGVEIDASSVVVEYNTIASNGVTGVVVDGTAGTENVYNDIEANSIYNNASLGIDLGGDGVTLNGSAGHSGPNNFQDFPVICSVTVSGSTVTVSGSLPDTAASSQYMIDLYNNPADDPSGHGQGQTFIGAEPVNGTGGTATFTLNFTISQALSGQSWSVTATDQSGNTSEFSADFDSTAAVQKQDAQVLLSSSQNPATYGQSVTFTATVTGSGAQPTGSVTFYDNGNALGTISLNGDTATFTTSSLSVAAHSITISYLGDSNYNQGSASLVQDINAIATTTSLSVSPSTSLYGMNVTLTATITPNVALNGTAATGTVQFFDGGSLIGTATLSGGTASVTVNTLAIGAHSLTAQYSGDSNFAGSSSGSASETVQVSSNTTLSVSTPSSMLGQTVTLTATVSPNINGVPPSGTVTFSSGTTTLGTGTLVNGVATLNVSSLPIGNDSLTAYYGGDTDLLPSSGTASEAVSKAGTSTSLVATPSTSTFGQMVTLTATVAPTSSTLTPTGTVSFMDGSNSLGTATLMNGVASIQVSTLAVGGHTITATYGGDSNFTGSSAMASESVDQAASSTTLGVSIPSSTLGQTVTLTATVTPTINGVVPTGNVTFSSGGTTLGTAALNASGVATLNVSSLPVGTDSLVAQYGGDSNFLASSGSNSETVNQAATSTSLSVTPASTTPGQTVTLTATVLPSITGFDPTGSVTFMDGSNSLGSASLNASDVATLQVSTLVIGSHTITAVYAGDGNFTGSTSNPVTETVNPAPSTISGTVTNDLTGNGFSPDDAALAGWTVDLFLNGTTALVATTVTAANGTYSFNNLAPGSYSVQEVLQAGWTETGGSAGYPVTAVSGNNFSGVNFDNFQNVSLGGTVYKDATGNGFSADDTPMSGVTVDLFANGGTTPVATATSASNGTYSFANLGPATYSVQEVVPAGYTLTGGASGYQLAVTSGQNASTDNFDNYLTPVPPPPPPPTGSISGYVFCDDNLDGIFDLTTWDGNVVSESGEAGATLTLTGTTSAGASVSLTTTSVTGGYYTFGGLSAGTYTVSLTGYSPNHQAELSHGSVNPTYSTKVTLASGQALTGPAEGQYGTSGTTSGLDFAEIAPGGLEGVVWDDTNNDGNVDYNEAGVVNVTIQLNGVTYTGAKVSQTTVTNNDGDYIFTNLQPGTYTLTEVTPSGFTDGKDSVGTLGGAEYFSSNCGSSSGCSTGSTNCGSNCGNSSCGQSNCGSNCGNSSCGQTNCGSDCNNSSCGNCCFNDCYSNYGYNCFTNYSTNCYNSNCGGNNCGNCGGNSQNCNSQCNCGWTSGCNNAQNNFSGIQIGGCENIGMNYNFGEHSQALSTGSSGCCGNSCQPTDTATVAFWHNSQGQALLCSLNGGPNSTALGNWLASMFPNIYGSSAKVDFAGMTNANIAAFYNANDFNVTGIKLDAAVLSAALSSYVTNTTWAGGTYATKYGFTVSAQGVGYDTISVGSDGVAFGVANNSTITILQALDATDQQAVDGTLYNGNATLRSDAYAIYAAIAQNGLST